MALNVNILPEQSVTQVLDTKYKQFAIYTIERRAIPSVIDGLKPVQRLLVFSGIQQGSLTKKVTETAAIAQYGYVHGEKSAYDGLINMAAEWCNNAPLFVADGNFGSRLVPEASAPRYLHTTLSNNFGKYFRDNDLIDQHPAFSKGVPITYYPTIRWILVNGISGIAVGFAVNILPRDPTNLTNACIQYLTTGSFDENLLMPVFPHFRGQVTKHDNNRFSTTGIVDKLSRNKYIITEVPIGFSRDSYFKVLTKLMEKQIIDGFEEHCDSTGFKFTVTASVSQRELIDKNPLSTFELIKYETENFSTIDENGKLKIFDSASDIVKYFCDYRVKIVRKRIDADIASVNSQLRHLPIIREFIRAVVDGEINLKTATKASIEEYITNVLKGNRFDVDKCMSLTFVKFVAEEVDKLSKQIDGLQTELTRLLSVNETKLFVKILQGKA